MATTAETGLYGEQIAEKYLEDNGFRIIGRRVRILRTDIDLLAEKGKTLHFVEVKTRTLSFRGSISDFAPEQAVNKAKMEQILQAAEHYTIIHGHSGEVSADLICVTFSAGDPDIKYYPGLHLL